MVFSFVLNKLGQNSAEKVWQGARTKENEVDEVISGELHKEQKLKEGTSGFGF